MTTLVTGGAGYIGSHTVRLLRRLGRDVVVIDSLELGSATAVQDTPLIVGDVADRRLVADTCRDYGVDEVVHFAAYKNVGESMRKPGKYWINNVAATVHLVETLLESDVDRLVFSSSCSVYGTPADVPVGEDSVIAPESVYAQTKATTEQVLRFYEETSGLRSMSLRYFNAAGASEDAVIGEDWTYALNLIPVAIKALLTDSGPLMVFGDDYPTPDGTCVRDYIHVDDLATAHVQALDHLASGGETLAVNIGTGVGTSVLQVIAAIEAVAGRPVPYTVTPRRAGDPVSTFADVTKAHAVLGWSAQLGLREIVESAYRWHLSQMG